MTIDMDPITIMLSVPAHEATPEQLDAVLSHFSQLLAGDTPSSAQQAAGAVNDALADFSPDGVVTGWMQVKAPRSKVTHAVVDDEGQCPKAREAQATVGSIRLTTSRPPTCKACLKALGL